MPVETVRVRLGPLARAAGAAADERPRLTVAPAQDRSPARWRRRRRRAAVARGRGGGAAARGRGGRGGRGRWRHAGRAPAVARRARRLGTGDTLEAMAMALADGLLAAGLVVAGTGADAVRVMRSPTATTGATSTASRPRSPARSPRRSRSWSRRSGTRAGSSAVAWSRCRAGLGETAAPGLRRLAGGRGAPLGLARGAVACWPAAAIASRRSRPRGGATSAPGARAIPARDPVRAAVLATRAGDDPFQTRDPAPHALDLSVSPAGAAA